MTIQIPSPHPTRRRFSSRRGQTLVEYALIVAFISVVAISTLLAMGSAVKGTYSTITSQLSESQAAGVSGRH
jgi:Flp pilus assembly pilin Flp